MVKKEVGWTYASWEFDFNHENLDGFTQAHEFYLARYHALFDFNAEASRERAGFLHFCGYYRLTLRGKIFYLLFQIKTFINRVLGRMSK